jgi:glycosyltransferase involved in cell wall biosynthesis
MATTRLKLLTQEKRMNLFASSPNLDLSGANVLLAKVFERACKLGHAPRWCVTSHDGKSDASWLGTMKLEFGCIPPTAIGAVMQRQNHLLDAIHHHEPCVYFPNYDFDMLWVAEVLPKACRTAFIVHSDDPAYYKAIALRGHVMDAIIVVSSYLANEVKTRWPSLALKVHHIPFGVDTLATNSISKPSLIDGPLEVVYCGRLVAEQKRIHDLSTIILSCYNHRLPIRFQIAGSGPDEDLFFKEIEKPIGTGMVVRHGQLSNVAVRELLQRSHAFILTSEYEGLPVSLLEAMASACVPVVTDIKSGIPDVIQHESNGFMLPIGDTHSFVSCLSRLTKNMLFFQTIARKAQETISAGSHSLDSCVERYIDLCNSLLSSERAAPQRKQPRLPPDYRISNRIAKRLCAISKGP